MKTHAATILTALATTVTVTAAAAQPAEPEPAPPSATPDCCTPPRSTYNGEPSAPANPEAPLDGVPKDDGGWKAPVGRRLVHGFRLGWTYVMNMDKPTREGGMSLAEEFELKSPNMMLLGYEGFYRVVGHSWLNVLMVGNVTIAGLEQSKPIPAASALLGFEFDRSFQLGVGVNLTPDPQSPSHMIAAAGWTPSVGSIQTPIHFFFVPDTERNHRMGATIGMSW